MFGSGFQFQFSKENKVILLRPTFFFFFFFSLSSLSLLFYFIFFPSQLDVELDEFSENIFPKLR